MLNKILCLVLAICMVLASGCAEGAMQPQPPAGIADLVEEYAEVEGYYTRLASDVYYEDGTLAALTYYVCEDEARTRAIGSKTVALDTDGSFYKYEVVIGMNAVEKMITKEVNSIGYTYTAITFDKNGYFIRGEFETVAYNAETKITSRSVGYQTYYNQNMLQSLHEDYYETPDGGRETLVRTTDKTYAENGELKEDKTVSYDSNGNMVQ